MKPSRKDWIITGLTLLLFVLLSFVPSEGQYRKAANGMALPDPSLTPGALRSGCTAVEVCAPGFKTGPIRKAIKNFPALKRKVCALYGVQKCDGSIEGDHLVSLELCGCPDCWNNLWPQPMTEARVKDHQAEDAGHAWVCAGADDAERNRRLLAIQDCIARDWTSCMSVMGSN